MKLVPTSAAKAPRHPLRILTAALVGLFCMASMAAPGAGAAQPKAILKVVGSQGEAGLQFNGANALGLAVNATGAGGVEAGSVYVLDAGNRRVQQLSKTGNFVRAWGLDVDKGGGTGFEICTVASECKAGVAAASDLGAAGSVAGNPMGGIAVDQETGVVYVNHPAKRRVDAFEATGSFIGAFGWGVKAGDLAPFSLDFCTTATGCQIGQAGSKGGQMGTGNTTPRGIAVNPTNGNVLIANGSNLRVDELDPTIAGGVLTGVAFVRAFGWDVIVDGSPSDPTNVTTFQICTVAEDCKAGTAGAGIGQFSGPTANNNLMEVAVAPDGAIYVLNALEVGCNATSSICRVQKFSAAAEPLGAVDPSRLTRTSGELRAHAISVDPETGHLYVSFHVSAPKYEVFEYDSAGTFLGSYPSAAGEELKSTSTVSGPVAVGVDGAIADERLVYWSSVVSRQIYILGPLPPPVVEAPECGGATATSVTCEAAVTIPVIESGGVPTNYRFEYSMDGTTWTRSPKGDLSLGSTPGEHEVERTIGGLKPNTLHLVRVCATTAATVCSLPTFAKTLGAPPSVPLVFPDEVTQTSAELGAYVNPNGLATSYYFEWGTSTAYGHRVPAGFERTLGEGTSLVISKEPIDGLEPETTYYFRLKASNGEGLAQASGSFETLNHCGLTNGRCFELVSPSAKGPVAAAGEPVAQGVELRFQANPREPEIAYEMANGLPTSTSPSEVLYQGARTDDGWVTSQIAPALSDPSQEGANGNPSFTLGLSEDLGCAVMVSTQRLTDDTPEGPLSAGNSNLFRRNADGSWTVLSNLEPTTLGVQERLYAEFRLVSVSSDCRRIVFRSEHKYGLPGAGAQYLYEWNNGVLSTVSEILGPGGPEAVEVVPGAPNPAGGAIAGALEFWNAWRAVSADGARIYFTAISKAGSDSGKMALFLRDGSGPGIDVSQSQTSTPNNDDSLYQVASRSGDAVFFLGRYGLAANGSSTGPVSCGADALGLGGPGCDLYRYTVSGGQLTDLTPLDAGSGASVAGVMAADDDGEAVYFAARGQLVPGVGLSESENLAEDQYSVYLARSGDIAYVGQITEQDATQSSIVRSSRWTSRVSADGDRLLFESRADFLGVAGDGLQQAYVFDANDEKTVCVSCRRDGKPSQNTFLTPPLNEWSGDASSGYSPARFFSADGGRVYFRSKNRLAYGAVEGKKNLYQWEDGQVSLIGSSPAGSASDLQFAGSSETGEDVYFTTLAQLVGADRDGQSDLYDARAGGGFSDPPAPQPACDPLSEGSCQGSGGGQSGAALPATSILNGAGNGDSEVRKEAKKKGKKSKKGKKHKKKKSQKGKRGKGSAGKVNRRAASENGRVGK